MESNNMNQQQYEGQNQLQYGGQSQQQCADQNQQNEGQNNKNDTLIGIVVALIIGLLGVLLFALDQPDSNGEVQSTTRPTEPACQHQLSGTVCEDYDTCTLCGEVVYDDSIHNYTKFTCTEDSVCTRCGKVAREALGHRSDATCIAGGECSRCGAWVSSAPHTYEQNVCTECGDMDIDPNTYGFYTANNGGRWIDITGYGYSESKGKMYAYWSGYHTYTPDVIEFKEGILYEYNYGNGTSGKPGTKVTGAEQFTMLNNDGISVHLATLAIYERFVYKGSLVLKCMKDSREQWYVLENQIDWSETEIIDDPDEREYKRYIFYFK